MLFLDSISREILLLFLQLSSIGLPSVLFFGFKLVSEQVVFVGLPVLHFLLQIRQLVWRVASVLPKFYRRLVLPLRY